MTLSCPSYAMYLPALVQLSSPAAMSNAKIKLPRPRGLWKAARETQPRLDTTIVPKCSRDVDDISHRFRSKAHYHNREGERTSDGDCCKSDPSSSSKRRRIGGPHSAGELEEEEEIVFWDYSRNCTPYPERLSGWITRTKVMDNTSIAGPGRPTPDRSSYDMEDWQDLKQLFAKAVEMYESALFLIVSDGLER